ncbi:hypothetical protein IscW_ISCW019564, partial [Ixodes scapularis]
QLRRLCLLVRPSLSSASPPPPPPSGGMAPSTASLVDDFISALRAAFPEARPPRPRAHFSPSAQSFPSRRTTRITFFSRASPPAMTPPPLRPVTSGVEQRPPPPPFSDHLPSFVCLTDRLFYHVALSGWTTALQGYADPSASFLLGAPLPLQVIFL